MLDLLVEVDISRTTLQDKIDIIMLCIWTKKFVYMNQFVDVSYKIHNLQLFVILESIHINTYWQHVL